MTHTIGQVVEDRHCPAQQQQHAKPATGETVEAVQCFRTSRCGGDPGRQRQGAQGQEQSDDITLMIVDLLSTS